MPSATESKPETRKVVSIVGPTASGKTGLGIAIAKALEAKGKQAEIVNADAYQMYKGMDIGTAKASPEEQAEVRHHLIDIIEPDDAMSVARFQEIARAKIAELQAREVRPILVGGSGLYARAAIDDISFPGTDPEVRKRLEERERVQGAGALFDELKTKDPEAAARMEPHRSCRRTIRALEVIEVTGRPYSASLPHYRYVIPTVQIGLDLPREELDRRIDIRTEQMLENGFVEEVERIRPLGITAGKALGYQQVVDYLDGLCDLNDTFMSIAQKTKRLARKQMGWFGRDPRIHWLQALNPALLGNAMAIIEHADAGDYDAIDAQAGCVHAASSWRYRLAEAPDGVNGKNFGWSGCRRVMTSDIGKIKFCYGTNSIFQPEIRRQGFRRQIAFRRYQSHGRGRFLSDRRHTA